MLTSKWFSTSVTAVAVAAALLGAAPAQAVTQAWVVRHDAASTGSGFGRQVLVDSAGNTRLVSDYGGLLVQSYGPGGTLLWGTTYSASGPALREMASIDSAGAVFALTASGHLLKFSAGGAIVADQDLAALYSTTGVSPVGTALRPDGSVVAAVNSGGQILVAGFDASLALRWRQELGDGGVDAAVAVRMGPQGVAYVAGTTDKSLTVWTVDATGNASVLSSGGPLVELTGFEVDAAGGFAATGNELAYDAVNDYWPRTGSGLVVRHFADGTPSWAATETGYRFMNALALAADGSVYVAGSSNWDGSFMRYSLVKYGAAGARAWEQVRDVYGNSDIYALALDQGEPIVTGEASYNPGYIATVKYSADGAELWSQSYQYGYSINGANYGRSLAVDAQRNVYVAGYTVEGTPYWYYKPTLIKYAQFAPDLTPPVTAVGEGGSFGNNGWWVSPVTVALTATDPGTPSSGVREIQYQLDGGALVAVPGAAATVTVSGDGSHTLWFRSVDNAGNAEQGRTFTYQVDTTAAVATATVSGTSGSNGWYRAATVTLASADPTSGATAIYYGTGPGAGTEVAGSSVTLSMTQGTTTVTYQAKNGAGIWSFPATTTVKVDGVAPAVTVAVSPTTIKANNKTQPVRVTGSATDAGSGVASTAVRVTDKAGALVATTTLGGTVNLLGKKGQVYTFTAVATDAAGNAGQAVATVRVQ